MAELPDPFHAGELAVQQRMGVGREAAANAALLRDDPDESTLRNVSRADMFFIGSHHPDRGLDASHRGGNAGFLAFDGDVLRWTQYQGNAIYQTMGNLALHPEVAVLVPDLATGGQIRFHGAARIDLGESVSVTVEVDSVSQEPSAMRRRWHVEKQSPHNPEARSSHGEVA